MPNWLVEVPTTSTSKMVHGALGVVLAEVHLIFIVNHLVPANLDMQTLFFVMI